MSPSSSSHTRLRSVWSKWSSAREKRKVLMLPTVMAAATEKVVTHRRSSPSQSQQIKSEDLTCSQFAHMAGIRILRENDDDETESDNDDDDVDDECAALTHGYGDQREMATSVHMGRSFSDRGSRRSQPQIWDPAFWQHQIQQQQDDKMQQTQPGAVMMTPLHSYGSTTSTTSSYSNPSSTCSSPPNLMRSGPSVIRKGRFKIVVGQDEEQQQQNDDKAEPKYVEWRRKRSCTT